MLGWGTVSPPVRGPLVGIGPCYPRPRKETSLETIPMKSDTAVPHGIAGPGRELWDELNSALEFHAAEQALVVELCRSVTLADLLSRELEALGLVVDGQRGPRVSPLVAELRNQRLTIARLVASLRIPDPEVGQRPRRRGAVRGVYGWGAS